MFLDSSLFDFKPREIFGTSELAGLDELGEKLGRFGVDSAPKQKDLWSPISINQMQNICWYILIDMIDAEKFFLGSYPKVALR